MKIFFCLLLAIVLHSHAKELSFKSSGIKSKALDDKFLKQILDFPGEYQKDLVRTTLELGVTQVFLEASYGYDKELIKNIVDLALESFNDVNSVSSVETVLKRIHSLVDDVRGKLFEELTSIYENLSQGDELDKELWNYVSQYPEKFGFTYSHYVVVKQANEILEKNPGSDVNDATKAK